MATSGSVDFKSTVGDLIKDALRKCSVGTQGETLDASDSADALREAETMLKAWQARGLHLWSYGDATLFLTPGQQSYTIGPNGDHATDSYTKTTLSAAASATDSTVDVDSISGISDGDNIGVVLDDDTFHWTTVNGAPSGSTVTLTDDMPSAAASGNAVYAYADKVVRPLRLHQVRIEIDGQQTPINQYSRQEYFDQPNKGTEGRPTQFYYNPTLDTGTLYLWPTSDTVDNLIQFTFEKPLEDFDDLANHGYMPVEWEEAFKYNLAYRMAFEYGVPIQTRQEIKMMANETLSVVESWDREDATVQLMPDFRY